MGNDAPTRRTLRLEHIRLTNDCRQRDQLDDNVVQKYAGLLSEGVRLPALRIVNDGSDNFLWDGYHTYHALKIAGFTQYHCEITQGDYRRAVYLACSNKRQHGIERTEEDIHRQIDTLLRDPQFRSLSIRTLGRHVGVSHTSIRRRQTYWREQQEVITDRQHWSVTGTESDPTEKLEVDQPLTPTEYLPEFITPPKSRNNTRANLRFFNRQVWKRCSAATKTMAQARSQLTKIKNLRPSRHVSAMLREIGQINRILAKLKTDSESLSRTL